MEQLSAKVSMSKTAGPGFAGTFGSAEGFSSKIPQEILDRYVKNQFSIEGLSQAERAELLTNIGIEPGTDDISVYKNLKKFHSQSKLYQKAKGLDIDKLTSKNFPDEGMIKRIGDELESVKTYGPAGNRFSKTLEEITNIYGKDAQTGEDVFSFNENLKYSSAFTKSPSFA